MSESNKPQATVKEILIELINLNGTDEVCEELDEVFMHYLQACEADKEVKSGAFLSIRLIKKIIRTAKTEFKLQL